jgi:uncharacterized RDD family membrane protein YckC
MAATDGKTLGKLLAGIRVVRDDGRRVGFWWAVYREVVIKGVVLGTAAALTGWDRLSPSDLLWPVWERENRTRARPRRRLARRAGLARPRA